MISYAAPDNMENSSYGKELRLHQFSSNKHQRDDVCETLNEII